MSPFHPCMDARGIPACSRWLRPQADTTGYTVNGPHPGGVQAHRISHTISAPRWHPCRGANDLGTFFPVVSLRSTTGYRLASLRDGECWQTGGYQSKGKQPASDAGGIIACSRWLRPRADTTGCPDDGSHPGVVPAKVHRTHTTGGPVP